MYTRIRLERFLLSHSHTPLGLLTVSRVIQTVVIVFLLLVIFWFLRRLLGNKIAIAGILLISFDPFFLGHSRLLNHEGMMSLFVMISLLAVLMHLFFERKLVYLLISGAAAGFAQLTKSSSIVLLPLIGLLFLVEIFFHREAGWRKRILKALAELVAWFGMLGIVYFVFWPGMWVAPGEMLYQVFGNALSYAFEGARLSVTGGVQPADFQPHLSDINSLYSFRFMEDNPDRMDRRAVESRIPCSGRNGSSVSPSVHFPDRIVVHPFVRDRQRQEFSPLCAYDLCFTGYPGRRRLGVWDGMAVETHVPEGVRRIFPCLVLGIIVIVQAGSAIGILSLLLHLLQPDHGRPGSPDAKTPILAMGMGLSWLPDIWRRNPGQRIPPSLRFMDAGHFPIFIPERRNS